jgi:hypothetical protein
LCLSRAAAQLPPADPRDVGTIEGIVNAYYDVINGPPGTPCQWRRDSTLYMPAARFVSMDEEGGKPVAKVMTPEEFRRSTNALFVEEGFFETEIGHRIERFGWWITGAVWDDERLGNRLPRSWIGTGERKP